MAEEVVAEGAQPAAEKYLTKEEFLTAQENLVGTLREMLAYRAPEVRAAPVVEAELPEPDDDDDSITAARKIVAKEMRNINRRLDEITQTGLDTMGAISNRVVAKELEYLNDYRDEIEAYRQRMPANVRAHPDAIKMAHDFVVSQHLGEIVQKKVDAAVRQAVRDDAPTRPSPHGRGRDFKVEGVPTPSELGLTDQQCAAVEARGGWDEWASKMSMGRFKDYKSYAEARQKHQNKSS